MNRQAICTANYSRGDGVSTSQRPFLVLLRDFAARLVLGDLRGGTT